MTTPPRYGVSFVCTGNICRSPMGDVILSAMVRDAGLTDRVHVESAGTGGWHEGDGADHRAVHTLAQHGYDGTSHRARQFDRSDWDRLDLVLALDRGHERELRRIAPTDADREKVRLLRTFDDRALAAGTLEVDDPYYGRDAEFERAFEEVESATYGVLDYIQAQVADRFGPSAGG